VDHVNEYLEYRTADFEQSNSVFDTVIIRTARICFLQCKTVVYICL